LMMCADINSSLIKSAILTGYGIYRVARQDLELTISQNCAIFSPLGV